MPAMTSWHRWQAVTTELGQPQLDRWETHELRFLRVISYVLLVACVGADVISHKGITRGVLVDIGAAAVTLVALAYAESLDRGHTPLHARLPLPQRQAAPIFVLVVALAIVLVVGNPLYGFYAWTIYFWSWRLLCGKWRFGGVAAGAIAVALSQTGMGPYRNIGSIAVLVAVYLVNLIVASVMTWFGWLDNERQLQRAVEIAELTQSNERLEASMAENARLHDQLLAQAREAGMVDERRRMAREIHDTLAQGLTGIITQLQAAQSAGAGAGGSDSTARIEAAIGLARESLSEARRSVQALAPQPLVGARLPDAVREVAERWSDRSGTPVAITTTGSVGEMSAGTELALLRTAQEALANVSKHARAERVGLTLSYMEDVVRLDVRDDGIGFATVNGTGPRRPVDAQGGFGLEAMRQRIEEVGGTLTIEAEPGNGTAISASVPVGC